MIRYITREKINIEKYDSCIESALNSRIYAFSWYLDIVADNWDALILNDYEAVMPLPWRQKYFVKYIYPPAWTQQLGVFSKNKISEALILEFINAIPKKFKKVTIQFNSENNFEHKNLTKRVNYILPLNRSDEEISKGINKNRRRDIKKATSTGFGINKNISVKEFLNFHLNEPNDYNLNKKQIDTLKELLISNNKAVAIWGVFLDGKLESCLVLLKDEKRITYLLPVTSQFGKEKGLSTFITSEIIKEFSNSDLLLDFEGSMIRGVAEFYKSFGSEKETYLLFKKEVNFKGVFLLN